MLIITQNKQSYDEIFSQIKDDFRFMAQSSIKMFHSDLNINFHSKLLPIMWVAKMSHRV